MIFGDEPVNPLNVLISPSRHQDSRLAYPAGISKCWKPLTKIASGFIDLMR